VWNTYGKSGGDEYEGKRLNASPLKDLNQQILETRSMPDTPREVIQMEENPRLSLDEKELLKL
jgi:hypothetical protein